ncbi:serine/threonine-protein phosphatase, partial [Streptomyces sp. NPDC127574]
SELIVRSRDLHPREAARDLIAAIIAANNGHLQDDATVMCLDWHGTTHSQRDATTGANLTSASGDSQPGQKNG